MSSPTREPLQLSLSALEAFETANAREALETARLALHNGAEAPLIARLIRRAQVVLGKAPAGEERKELRRELAALGGVQAEGQPEAPDDIDDGVDGRVRVAQPEPAPVEALVRAARERWARIEARRATMNEATEQGGGSTTAIAVEGAAKASTRDDERSQKPTVEPATCSGCGRVFASANALKSHARFCKAKKRRGAQQACAPETAHEPEAALAACRRALEKLPIEARRAAVAWLGALIELAL